MVADITGKLQTKSVMKRSRKLCGTRALETTIVMSRDGVSGTIIMIIIY